MIELLAREIVRQLKLQENRERSNNAGESKNGRTEQIMDMLKKSTTARIGVGKSGARLKTDTFLSLRADHAKAKDSVMKDVSPQLIDRMGLFTVQTECSDRNEHLTRPDLGRSISRENREKIILNCKKSPQVQIYLSDGLSSQAVESNGEDILPVLMESLNDYGIDTGTPFFMKFGRVPAMDVVSEILDAEVTCVLIGERPGLATADSMSAYIAYRAYVGMAEAKRTVVSNIYSEGIPAVEAGAYLADVIKRMLEEKSSGVDLKL